MKSVWLALAATTVLASCQSGTEKNETTQPVPTDWRQTASIYEANIRQHTPEGSLNAFTQDLPRIADMGIGIVWVMPIQPIGVEGRKDPDSSKTSLGSYYSISDYTAVSSDYGTEADFKAMVDEAHRLGLHVILDWVANHTAFDHHWVSEHPDFYTQTEDGTPSVAVDNDGNVTDWTDVADLNYDNPAMREAMIEEMRWWLTEMNIDGFRCDVAGFVPMSFWEAAIPELKKTKADIFMLAEWDEPDQHSVFDMSYGWDFHHRTNEVAKGNEPATTFDDYLNEVLDSVYNRDAMKMLFTTNHDENSWNGTVYERYGDGHKAFFVLCATFQQGMPLVYSGQEAGLSHRLEFFYKDTVRWENRGLEAFYEATLKAKTANPALWNGQWGGDLVKISTDADDRIYAFSRSVEGNTVVVFINLSSEAAEFNYTGAPEATYEEVYSGNLLNVPGEGAMSLDPWGYMVFSSNITSVD